MVDKHAKITGRTTKKVERGGGVGVYNPPTKIAFFEKGIHYGKKEREKIEPLRSRI